MVGIRLNKLCKQFDIRTKALVDFLSSKGLVVSSSPNSMIPESAISLLQKEFGNKENKEALAMDSVESAPVGAIPAETKTETAEPLVLPDSPYRNGVTGKYKLLVKNVTELFGNFEYSLVDAEENKYKAITEQLYSKGDILRCVVSFKIENARLVIENVAICKKQDLATPIAPPQKNKPIHAEPKSKPKLKTNSQSTFQAKPKGKSKTTSIITSTVKPRPNKLGNPSKTMVSGEYNLRVYERSRCKMLTGSNYTYFLEDANKNNYFALSDHFFEIGCILACDVIVKDSWIIKEVSILYKVMNGPKRKRKEGQSGGGKRNTGLTQYDWAGTHYSGGCHIIYTRM